MEIGKLDYWDSLGPTGGGFVATAAAAGFSSLFFSPPTTLVRGRASRSKEQKTKGLENPPENQILPHRKGDTFSVSPYFNPIKKAEAGTALPTIDKLIKQDLGFLRIIK